MARVHPDHRINVAIAYSAVQYVGLVYTTNIHTLKVALILLDPLECGEGNC